MSVSSRRFLRVLGLGTAIGALAGCASEVDWDLRRADGMLRTTEAAQQATVNRPRPDERGVISYPNYQVAVARRGDRVSDLADRVGLSAGDLARFNGLSPDDGLRPGEVLALPRMVGPAAGGAPGSIDITSLASGAIDRAEGAQTPTGPRPEVTAAGPEPVRHQVVRGETAYSISRLYGISPRALADWNGLGPDLGVREGQYLLIPVTREDSRTAAAAPPTASPPGRGTPTPAPPSAAQPLPDESPAAADQPAPGTPASPDLGAERSTTSTAQFVMPVTGPIIREFAKGRSDGIQIAASAGTPVRAAADGTVAAITRDTDQVTIVVIRHSAELLTVYANIDGLTVERNDRVARGQTIAQVAAGDPAFIEFQVRRGLESLDPMPFLQ